MSFWRNYYHLTWSTKNLLPLIKPEIESQLFHYMTRKAAELEVFIYAIDGTEDHVHLVVSIPPKHSVAEVVKLIKGASAHYVNHSLHLPDQFAWQPGYGCLTVGEKQRPLAEVYVKNQKIHHADGTTIGWLENALDLEGGPEDHLEFEVGTRQVSESAVVYSTGADSAF